MRQDLEKVGKLPTANDMLDVKKKFDGMIGSVPDHIRREVALCGEISEKIDALMKERGLSRKQFADAIGKRPSEITKWLSGQHNFTISTLATISSFFDCPIISVD